MRDQTSAPLTCSSSRYSRSNILGKVAFLLLCIAGCTQAASNDGVHPEQVLTGPIYQVGDYIECLYGREAKYCMTRVQLKAANSSSPFWIKIQEVSKLQTHFRRDLLYVGLCVPAQSSVSDISKGFEDSLNDAARKLGVTAEVELDQQKCQSKHGPPYNAAHFFTVLGSLGLIFLALCGSRNDGLRRLKENETPIITRGMEYPPVSRCL
ncbi:uncharacterized protein LOC111864298 [Cryptotermes secundus]|uniref:uncharacterized protein LOC111864298 n=1 Tax=Cryptotermes secundus TaxID=105785 RepID=UPI001454CA60|nr:uncharacterized protein LOC111864298 [Cryptotermes secundus]